MFIGQLLNYVHELLLLNSSKTIQDLLFLNSSRAIMFLNYSRPVSSTDVPEVFLNFLELCSYIAQHKIRKRVIG